MRLRVLAPTLVDFQLTHRGRDHEQTISFWKQRAEAIVGQHDTGAVVRLPRAAPRSRFNRYTDIETDSLEVPPHVMELEIPVDELGPPASIDDSVDQAMVDCRNLSSVRVQVHDHGIALVEAEFHLPEDVIERLLATDGATALQASAVAWGGEIARAAIRNHVNPVVERLREDDSGVIKPSDADADSDLANHAGEPLWVTRTLIADSSLQTDAELHRHSLVSTRRKHLPGSQADLARRWLSHLVGTDQEELVDALVDPGDECDHVTRWLNYVYVDTNDDGRLDALWKAMRLAQYHYAALERADRQLAHVLNEAMAADAAGELRALRRQLEQISLQTRLITMERPDAARYLSRTVLQEVDAILTFWDYEGALLDPAEAKIAAAEQRLRQLEAEAAERASRYTDYILIGLTVTTITGTMLAVADFGRSSAVTPQTAAYDVGRDNFIQSIAAQSSDAILFLSLILSLVVAALYVYFRSDTSKRG